MSNLVDYAKQELEFAGFYQDDADYGNGAIAEAVLEVLDVLERQGHSGGSHYLVMELINRLANYKALTPLTDNPDEWMNVSDYSGPNGTPVFQSRRNPACFSNDGGKTYYDIDANDNRAMKNSEPYKKV